MISRFSLIKQITESQIVAVLNEAEAGIPTKELYRHLNLS